jgi:hypothetical protein
MAYKNTAAINKPWLHTGTSGFSLGGLITKLRNAVSMQIPVGYQDESGFHTGVKSATKEVKWPTTW